MGYSGYWKFQNVIDKAIKVASEKGMNIDEHFNHAVDMFKEGIGEAGKSLFFSIRIYNRTYAELFGIQYLTV